MQLSFLGAAGEVTGSCYLVDTGEIKFLIECGMRQGGRHARALNRRFAFAPRDIAFVLLSHAHIDHSGLLPRLVAQGFGGPIYATAATRYLCGVMLPDAGHIQESEVRHLNRRNRERGRATVQLIYTARDGARVLRQFRSVKYGEWTDAAPGLRGRARVD